MKKFILFLSLIFLPNFCFGATWITDNLTTYPSGWTGDTGSFTTTTIDTPWASSTLALHLTGTGSTLEILHSITSGASDSQVICTKQDTTAGWNKIYTYGTDEDHYMRLTDTGYIIWKHGGAGGNTNIQTYAANQWYCIKYALLGTNQYQVIVWDVSADTYTTTTADSTTFGYNNIDATSFRIGESYNGEYYWSNIGADFPVIQEEETSTPATTTAAVGQLNFPQILIAVFAFFILCFIIDKGGDALAEIITNFYLQRNRYKY